jgi:hypothetical protein
LPLFELSALAVPAAMETMPVNVMSTRFGRRFRPLP